MPPIILLIQNDPADATAVQDALSAATAASFIVEWVRHCSAGIDRLRRSAPPCSQAVTAVLVDLMLPDCTGIETLNRLLFAAPRVPILVISGAQDEAIARSAVQLGAQDYLLKSRIDSYTLPKAVTNMIERAANAEALFAQQERAQVTLNSIGDAVMSVDLCGKLSYLNAVAEQLTGWRLSEAAGQPVQTVFHIVNGVTRDVVTLPTVAAIRENKTVSLTPNCILVRRDGVEIAIEDSAAPIHDRRGQVSGAVMVFRDVTQARALAEKMSRMAQYDALTELPNRILLTERLRLAITAAERHQRKLALLFIDIDHFKHINDSLGHATGDHLLQSLAQRLCACVRSTDTVSRQGGDEFVILLSEIAQAQDAVVTAEKILQILDAPQNIDGHQLRVTASVGIATYPDDGLDVDTLIRNADMAMYHAKNSGRGNYQLFTAEMNVRAIDRQSMISSLRDAMQYRQFMLHYQPKVRLDTGRIVGAEALIRWQHPQLGAVAPAHFVPIAEESGFIVPIDRWVLREACRQTRAWQDAGLPPLRIAVNISAVDLRAKTFVQDVKIILDETGLAAQHLELELTETFLVEDSQSVYAVLKALSEMGVQLALDDFGTGYSSLSYLKRFPIDSLKIDSSFVRDMTTDAENAGIVRAVIGMARDLRLRVVAEGVETREQLEFLQQQGCLEAQGHYFSPALDAYAFAALLSGKLGHATAAASHEHDRRA